MYDTELTCNVPTPPREYRLRHSRHGGVDVICHRAIELDSTGQHAQTYSTDEACIDARDRFRAQPDAMHQLDQSAFPKNLLSRTSKTTDQLFLFDGPQLVPLTDVTRPTGQPSITRVEIPRRYTGRSVVGSCPDLLLERHVYSSGLVSI